MIANMVSHTTNMHTMRPSVHPALNRLVTTSWHVTERIHKSVGARIKPSRHWSEKFKHKVMVSREHGDGVRNTRNMKGD